MTFARSLADVADVAAVLGEPVHALLGHSWGGAVAIGAGRELDVARVVAIDPMLNVASGVWAGSVIPQYVELLAPPPHEREALIRAANAALPAVEVEAKLHAARRIALAPIAALGAENGIDEGRWNFQALLADYPRPLWLAVAGSSAACSRRTTASYARERGGPNLRLTEYEGASHSLQRDAFERFVPDLEAFLALP